MRFLRLDLVRFGKFTERSVDLPRGANDLHIIVGANEAGKSTTRAAVGDLLFGIAGQSPYNFQHEYRQMCIGAVVENGAGPLEVRRRKGSKNTLTDAADAVIPEERLVALLGGADRELFERMFSLDHNALVEGGQSILDAKDDVGRMLFESASGIGGLAELRRELEEEAAGLWSQRKSQKAAYHRASEALKDAQRRLSDAAVKVPAWSALRRDVDAAEQELASIVEECGRLEQERTRLDRLRRVAPMLALRAQKLGERAALGAVVLLPPDARVTLENAERGLSDAEITIAQLESAVEGCKSRGSIVVDDALLARRDAIDRLVAESYTVAPYPDQIGKRQVEVDGLQGEVARLAHNLGWREVDPEALRSKLPAELLRTTLEALAQQPAVLDTELRSTTSRLTTHRHDIEELEQALAQAPPGQMPAGLVDALKHAESLGDIAKRCREHAEQQRTAAENRDRDLGSLESWSGSLDELAALALPDVARLSQLQVQRDRTHANRAAAAERLADLQRGLDAKNAEITALLRSTQAVSPEELHEARRKRDEAWGTIKTSFVAGSVDGTTEDRSARASLLDATTSSADQTADRRHDGASESARLEQASAARFELQSLVDAAAMRVADEEKAAAEIEAAWSEMLAPLGLAGLDNAGVLQWLQHRKLALVAHADAIKAESALRVLQQQGSTAGEALRKALSEAGQAATELADLRLPGLIARAGQVRDEVSKSVGKRTQDEKQLTKLQRDLPGIESDVRGLEEKRATWQVEWRNALAANGLPAETAPAAIGKALGWFRDLEDKIGRIGELRASRIAKMQRALEVFATSAVALARDVAADAVSSDASEIASMLRQRLETARSADSKRCEALAELEQNQTALVKAAAMRDHLDGSLAPLRETCGATSLGELRQAIALSEAARKLDEEADAAADRAIEEGEGRRLDELESEDAADDRETRVSRNEELRQQMEAAQGTRQAAAMKLSTTEALLDAVAGQADAATAAEEREGALAELRDAVERYVKVRLAARLVSWSVERYRREKQGPLLRRASELFSALTLGGFARLEADDEDGKPRIIAIRDNEQSVPIEGMSTGARDQLYLALRIAALESHIEKAAPLPVIVDDVLINFDDARAAAGLQVFAELATKTQVLVFTHHAHLADVARGVLGDGVQVVEL